MEFSVNMCEHNNTASVAQFGDLLCDTSSYLHWRIKLFQMMHVLLHHSEPTIRSEANKEANESARLAYFCP